jgi:hypothetical protein
MTAPSLARKTFTVSRQSEFASTAELVKATGHPVERWPLVIAIELVDNKTGRERRRGVRDMFGAHLVYQQGNSKREQASAR